MFNFKALSDAVLDLDAARVADLTKKALEEGLQPEEIVNKGLICGMNEVGKLMKEGEMYVPEVLMAAKAMHAGMDVVKPLLAGTSYHGKVVIGTVAGDLHDIGKNLVAMMMDSGGLEVIDLGIDVAPEAFVAAVKEHKPDVVAMSALLTTTMLNMKETIDLLKKEGLGDSVKVIVGGAPVSADFANEIGADGFAEDAASAKDLALALSHK